MKLVAGITTFVVFAFLAWWLLRDAPLVSVPANFTVQDVVSGLPVSADSTCVVEIGEFGPAPDLLVPHVEGAIGAYDGELFLVSGFSHYLQKHLMATPRVDRRPRGQEDWVPVSQQAPTVGSHFQAATRGPMLWLAGGFLGDSPGKATADVWRYNMQEGIWSEGPKLPESRASGGFLVHDGGLHYISGLAQDRETGLVEHLSLDPDTRTAWKVVTEFPRPRNHFQAVSLGGFIYAVGGMTGHDKTRVDVAHVDVYHPGHAQWLPVADMPESRSHAEMGTFVYQDRIIVVGGRSGGKILASLDSIIEYNPYKNEWRQAGSIPVGLYGGFAYVVNDKIYVGGGGRIWREPNYKVWSAEIGLDCE